MPFRLTLTPMEPLQVGNLNQANRDFPEWTVAPLGSTSLMIQICTSHAHASNPTDKNYPLAVPGVILALSYPMTATPPRPINLNLNPQGQCGSATPATPARLCLSRERAVANLRIPRHSLPRRAEAAFYGTYHARATLARRALAKPASIHPDHATRRVKELVVNDLKRAREEGEGEEERGSLAWLCCWPYRRTKKPRKEL